MSPNRILQRWTDSQQRLLLHLSSLLAKTRRRGSDTNVHDLRVVTRRVRLHTRLAATLYGRSLSHSFRDWARHTASLTDPVRDLDVALEWLDSQPIIDPTIRRTILKRRNRVWKNRRPRLQSLPRGLLHALTDTTHTRKSATRLAKRCARLEQELKHTIRSDAPRFFHLGLEAQHDFRRLVRRWRYLRELLIPEHSHASDRLLQKLLKLQEALGDRQNLYLADAALAAMTRPHPGVPQLRQAITQALLSCETTIRSRLKPFARITDAASKSLPENRGD